MWPSCDSVSGVSGLRKSALLAIEYVLIASLISVAAITAMGKVGGKVSNVLSGLATDRPL